jgi:hypothetical protein
LKSKKREKEKKEKKKNEVDPKQHTSERRKRRGILISQELPEKPVGH